MSFAAMKKSRSKSIQKLVEEATKMTTSSSSSQKDERYWEPKVDKAGNGYAVIRFMPAPEGEDLPWVRYWDHAFKGPSGLWYIEKSLTTLGQSDPVSETNSEIWNTGREDMKAIARERRRRLHYVSNIYIISDPAAPENEGKVFLFKYGKKIFEKIMDAMQPEFEDEESIVPFDFWEGADFKMKIRQVDGYRNFDKSEFVKNNGKGIPFMDGNDEKLEKIYGTLYPLLDIIDPSHFKSYDELKTKFLRVIGSENTMKMAAAAAADASDDGNDDSSTAAEESNVRSFNSKVGKSEPPKSMPTSKSKPNDSDIDDDEDDTLSYFARLAAES
jgi:hypothetical protein